MCCSSYCIRCCEKTFVLSGYEGSSLLMQNVEALSQDAGENNPCDNINGFRSWAQSGFLQRKREFYDCCYVLQEGYSPDGNCRK